MIKTIIFDFGDVFINLDQEGAMQNALHSFNIKTFSGDIENINKSYEKGLISTETFLGYYQEKFPNISKTKLIDIWNFMLKDFPERRLQFIKELKASGKFKLILLSNTNELHIQCIKENFSFYEDFKNCFDVFYLSHQIQLRKPNRNIFEFVLNQNKLNARECLFIDDNKENTITAQKLGITVWNINPKSEDITTLFNHKSIFFD